MVKFEGLRLVHSFSHMSLEDSFEGTNPKISFEGKTLRARQFFRYPPRFIMMGEKNTVFPRISSALYVYSDPYKLEFQNSYLCGYRAMISNKKIFLDYNFKDDDARSLIAKRFTESTSFAKEDILIQSPGSGEDFAVEYHDHQIEYIDDWCSVLVSTEPSNYGSFLFRILPKILSLTPYQKKYKPIISYIINNKTRELLNLFGVEDDNIIPHNTKKIYQITKATFPSLRSEAGFLDHETLSMYSGVRAQFTPSEWNGRLYVSRRAMNLRLASPLRVMINEDEVIEFMARAGFEIVEPESLSVPDLIAKFSGARIVVGPSGSGMFNCVFCRPGTRVIDIESEPNWIWTHAGLFSSLQLDYGLVVGEIDAADPRLVHKRWMLDLKLLKQAMGEMERRP